VICGDRLDWKCDEVNLALALMTQLDFQKWQLARI
jgi:hypothetical protein